MMTVISVVLALIGLLVLLYLAYPGWVYDKLVQLGRKRGGTVERKVLVNGRLWPYLEGGRSGAETVVLIHGFGGDKDNWTLYAPFMTEHYRVIMPDLPGFGDNERRIGDDYSIKAQADRLKAFLDAIGIDKCHLGGNSMGGFIVLRFALDYPERLHSLTLLNNAGVRGTAESELEQAVARDPLAKPLAVRSLADLDRLLVMATYQPPRIPGAFKRVMYERFKPYEVLLDQIFEQMLQSLQEDDMNSKLGDITTPTLIIWGRHDRLIDVSCTQVLQRGIKNSELVIFEDVGHVPMIEQPARTASAQRAFLAKH
ncbi:MAG: alpha/beta fold hydrolase [Parahaliea sp.]